MSITINSARCVKCGQCVQECPVYVIRQNSDGAAEIKPERESDCISCQHCMALCPAEAISVNGISPEKCVPSGALPSEDSMMNLIRQRRSIRSWSKEPLDESTLLKLQSVLDWTPTGCNIRNLHFTFVTKPEIFDHLRKCIYGFLNRPIINWFLRLRYKPFRPYLDEIAAGTDVVFRNAPYMVIASVNKKAPCAAFDPVIALSYFDLYAQSLGVGTCWCGFAEGVFRKYPRLVTGIQLPAGYRPGAVMLFGKPGVSYPRSTAQGTFEKQIL